MTKNKFLVFLYLIMIISILGWGISLLLAEKEKKISTFQVSSKIESALPKDKISIVHFFSSWCVYCRVEYPYLLDLKSETDLPIVGIAYKDQPEQMVPWLDHMGNPFSDIIYDPDAKISYEMGVMSIPQTFVVDQKGQVIYAQKESLTRANYKKLLDFIHQLHEKN